MFIELMMLSNHLVLCHPLSVLNLSQHQSLFQSVGSDDGTPKESFLKSPLLIIMVTTDLWTAILFVYLNMF